MVSYEPTTYLEVWYPKSFFAWHGLVNPSPLALKLHVPSCKLTIHSRLGYEFDNESRLQVSEKLFIKGMGDKACALCGQEYAIYALQPSPNEFAPEKPTRVFTFLEESFSQENLINPLLEDLIAHGTSHNPLAITLMSEYIKTQYRAPLMCLREHFHRSLQEGRYELSQGRALKKQLKTLPLRLKRGHLPMVNDL